MQALKNFEMFHEVVETVVDKKIGSIQSDNDRYTLRACLWSLFLAEKAWKVEKIFSNAESFMFGAATFSRGKVKK